MSGGGEWSLAYGEPPATAVSAHSSDEKIGRVNFENIVQENMALVPALSYLSKHL